MSKVRVSGLECQDATAQERLREATLCPRSVVSERSYPVSEVSGGREETPCIRGQGRRPGGDTPRPQSGAAAERSCPTSEASGLQEKPPRARGQGR